MKIHHSPRGHRYAAFPICDCAGNLVSLCMWGFSWHCPQNQAMMSSLFMASVGLSSYLAVVLVWLVTVHALSPVLVWLVPAGLACLSSVLLLVFAVGKDEFHAEASAVTGQPSKPNAVHIFRASCNAIAAWNLHPRVNYLFVVSSCPRSILICMLSALYCN